MPRLLAAGLVALTVAGCGSARHDLTATQPQTVGDAVAQPPRSSTLAFEPNAARTARVVDYVAHGKGYTLALTRKGPLLRAADGRELHTTLIGAAAGRPRAVERRPGVVNWYVGPRSKWREGLPTFGRVVYPGAWPGIDVAYHGTAGNLEYDFELRPGADPADIGWRIGGGGDVTVDPASGDLVVATASGTVRQPKPLAWQGNGAQRRAVQASFRVSGGVVRLEVGAYDSQRPLTIDPQLVYATYLGGPDVDFAWSVGVDAAKEIFVAGVTGATGFPGEATGTTYGDLTHGEVLFVVKYDPTGQLIEYATFIGSASLPTGMAVSADGEAYVVGNTFETDFPTTSDAAQKDAPGGGQDGYAIKLDAAGARAYATYVGGNGSDQLMGRPALAPDGSLGFTGYADAGGSNIPVTSTPIQSAPANTTQPQAFVGYLAPDGKSFGYLSWFSATGGTYASSITTSDFNGRSFYVTGTVFSGTVPGSTAAAAKPTASNRWVYVAKLDLSASGAAGVVWSKTLGGTDGQDLVDGIVVDSGGEVTMAGTTSSTNWADVGNLAGMWLLHLDYYGGMSGYKWARVLTGLSTLNIQDMAVDPQRNVYITGSVGGGWPQVNQAEIQSSGLGGVEAIIGKFKHGPTGGGDTLFASYLGGSTLDVANGVAVDGQGGVYVVGKAVSSDFPLVNPQQATPGGSNDGFVAKIVPSTGAITSFAPHEGEVTTDTGATFNFTPGIGNTTATCYLDRGTPNERSSACTGTKTYLSGSIPEGAHTFEFQSFDDGGTSDGTFVARHWTVDTSAPFPFALSAPADNGTVGAQPELSWEAAADAATSIASYRVIVDGQTLAASAPCCKFTVPTALSQGAHPWKVVAVDQAGHERESATRTFTVQVPLALKLSVSPNPALVGAPVTFDGSGSADASHSIAKYEFDLDGDGAFERDNGAQATTSQTYPVPGTYNVGMRVTDSLGQSATTTVPLHVNALPTLGKQFGVSINKGAQYTRSPDVTVTATFPVTITSMLFSNDGGFFAPAVFAPLPEVKWKLDSSGPERLPKTIYVRFLTSLIPSETFQDDIILDEIPPKVSQAAVSAPPAAATVVRAAKLKTWKVKVKATDSNSGVASVQVTANKKKPGKPLKYKTKLTVKSAARPKFVRARDRAGNFSTWKKAH